ncbi:hypothetical protein K2173_021312 [Erythroxylum novogranatense]|uniref:BHLH domain-containing protein n=1 Tax=Erythroxylum novogranatense TaxID=1862640 RepID=A0AAV8TUQ1_9ROSI|nr:hypothetical protein K2173_021312 [Erythroxylum novogranatense]
MADMYNYENFNTCSSSSMVRDHRTSDEMSLFLHQMFLRSSSSSSLQMAANNGLQEEMVTSEFEDQNRLCRSGLGQDSILGMDLGEGVKNDGGCFSGNVNVNVNVSSSSVGGASGNETDDFDEESEEGLEAGLDEVPAKQAPTRKSSKRSRAAEVHNLSEKRRRSRINEKMKALQNLIPNSNKTDKASMLDEAIEYLKQLQLQVQMLSLRNGISLYPISVPGLLQPIHLSQPGSIVGNGNGSHHMNVTGAPVNTHALTQNMLNLQKTDCPASNQLSAPNVLNIINSDSSFGLEQSILDQLAPFDLEEICGQDVHHQQLNAYHSERNASEFEMGGRVHISLPLETRPFNLADSSFNEVCMMGRHQNAGLLLKNLEQNLLPSQASKGKQTGTRDPCHEVKMEGQDF